MIKTENVLVVLEAIKDLVREPNLIPVLGMIAIVLAVLAIIIFLCLMYSNIK